MSYNLKKLVDAGYMHHERSEIDRRSVRVRLTEKGRGVHLIVSKLFKTHAEGLMSRNVFDQEGVEDIAGALKRVERYWTEQIQYIYQFIRMKHFYVKIAFNKAIQLLVVF